MEHELIGHSEVSPSVLHDSKSESVSSGMTRAERVVAFVIYTIYFLAGFVMLVVIGFMLYLLFLLLRIEFYMIKGIIQIFVAIGSASK
jgi:hypothetical protein